MKDLLLLPTGVLVGIANAVAGGGGLLSFPLMVALGYSSFTANLTITVGAFPSSVGSAYGYRNRLFDQNRSKTLSLCAAGAFGSLIGSLLLVWSGAATFKVVVPWLLVLSSGLVLVQPRLTRTVRQKENTAGDSIWPTLIGTGLVGTYGGYFGVAMGVMFLGAFGVLIHQPWQQLNAWKNAVTVAVNAIAVIVFALLAHIAWRAGAFLALGSLLGGFLGAHIAQQLADRWFRIASACIGIIAAAYVALR